MGLAFTRVGGRFSPLTYARDSVILSRCKNTDPGRQSFRHLMTRLNPPSRLTLVGSSQVCVLSLDNRKRISIRQNITGVNRCHPLFEYILLSMGYLADEHIRSLMKFRTRWVLKNHVICRTQVYSRHLIGPALGSNITRYTIFVESPGIKKLSCPRSMRFLGPVYRFAISWNRRI